MVFNWENSVSWVKKLGEQRLLTLTIFLVTGAVVLFKGQAYFNLESVQAALYQLIEYYEQSPIVFTLLFIASYIFLITLYIPGPLVLNLLIGAIMGPVLGTIVATIAATLGSMIAFFISRYFLQEWVRTKHPKQARAVDIAMQETGLFYVFMLRLAPALPIGLTNMLMGATSVPSHHFFSATLIGVIPWIAFYAAAGRELATLKSLEGLVSIEMSMLVLTLIALMLLGHFLLKRLNEPKTASQ